MAGAEWTPEAPGFQGPAFEPDLTREGCESLELGSVSPFFDPSSHTLKCGEINSYVRPLSWAIKYG
jgi:hypothetical protein